MLRRAPASQRPCPRVISENPYRLARDIRGIGFKTADQIAAKVGIAKDAMIRVRAGVSYALSEAMDDGHCGLPEDELVKVTVELIEVSAPLIETAMALELLDGTVVADTVDDRRCIFLAGLYRAEQAIADRLRTLAGDAPPWPEIDVTKAIPWLEGRVANDAGMGHRYVPAEGGDQVAHAEAPDLLVIGYDQVDGRGERAACVFRRHRGGNRQKPLHVADASAMEAAIAFGHRKEIGEPRFAVHRHRIGVAGQHDARPVLGADRGQQVRLASFVVEGDQGLDAQTRQVVLTNMMSGMFESRLVVSKPMNRLIIATARESRTSKAGLYVIAIDAKLDFGQFCQALIQNMGSDAM